MLYLKYRPQIIEELDNERIRETLGKKLLNNEWAHAYLLIGTRGSGKTTMARLIAKTVNCVRRRKGEEACNRCESCLAITAGGSLDVMEIGAASNTGVDDIRELRERVKLAPTASRFKVYIIDEAHMLSNSAFNALLKTLEEPPEHVIFVLATTDPQKLPATIVSRCLVYDFGQASETEIIRSVKRVIAGEGIEASEEAVRLIAKRANGSLRDAHKMIDQLAMGDRKISKDEVLAFEGGDRAEETAEKLLALLAGKDSRKSLEMVEGYVGGGGRVRELLVSLLERLREALLRRSGMVVEGIELDMTTAEIQKLVGALIEAGSLVRESPVAQLPLEMVIVEFCSQGTKVTSVTSVTPVTEVTQVTKVAEKDDDIAEKWGEILAAVKPHNNNLSALLRSSRPRGFDGEFLTIEAFYKFHRDKLMEVKNREILEKVISGIMGKEIKVKFALAEKK